LAPPATLGALLLVLALVPGWIYLRLVERLKPPTGTSGLHQLLEVLAVGVGTTGVSAMALALVPHGWLPFTLNLRIWAAKDGAYLRTHYRAATWSVALVFVVAVGLAYLLYGLRSIRRPAEFRSQGDVWVHSIGERPAGTHPYLGLQLKDGRLVEGPLHAYTFGAEAGKRDIALAKPIRITPAAGGEAIERPNLDRLIVPESALEYITVIHVRAKGTGKHRRWRRRS
jgi:hypothetical protein